MPRRFEEAQIRKILEEAKTTTVGKLGKKYGFSEAVFYQWKKKFGPQKTMANTAPKSLQEENSMLRDALGEALVENALLKQKYGV